MTALGTESNPISSNEPMKVARAIVRHKYSGDGTRGIVKVGDSFFCWSGTDWEIRPEAEIMDDIWKWMEDAHYVVDADKGVIGRLSPSKSKVEGVFRAMEAVIRVDSAARTPLWLEERGGRMPDVEGIIAFKNVLIDVKATIFKDELVTYKRDKNWFSHVTMCCDWEEEAVCPIWNQCLEEWSTGDKDWITLLQRWFGYCLLSHRRYAKWMLLHGKIRAGKGTIANVLRALTDGGGYVGVSLEDLADGFGLAGLEHARVLSISEVSKLETKDGERASRVLKNILGRDPVRINQKFKKHTNNVVLDVAPMMQANEIPNLPNKGRGLSGKMLVLPFRKSFEGHENFDLLDDLLNELPGIAKWAVQGALELEKERKPELKFPLPESAKDALHVYQLSNNPWDHFLTSRFMQVEGAFVAHQLVVRQFRDWCRRNRVKMHVSDNRLSMVLIDECSWPIERARQKNTGARGIKGLAIRKEYADVQ